MLLGHHWLFEDWFFFNQFCFRPFKLLWVSHDFCFQNSLNGKIYWKDIGWISRPIIGTNEVSLLHPVLFKPFKCLACARDWSKIHPISSRKVFLRKKSWAHSAKSCPGNIVDFWSKVLQKTKVVLFIFCDPLSIPFKWSNCQIILTCEFIVTTYCNKIQSFCLLNSCSIENDASSNQTNVMHATSKVLQQSSAFLQIFLFHWVA